MSLLSTLLLSDIPTVGLTSQEQSGHMQRLYKDVATLVLVMTDLKMEMFCIFQQWYFMVICFSAWMHCFQMLVKHWKLVLIYYSPYYYLWYLAFFPTWDQGSSSSQFRLAQLIIFPFLQWHGEPAHVWALDLCQLNQGWMVLTVFSIE